MYAQIFTKAGPLMALPIVALMLFIAIFAVAVARACFKKDAEVRALSALPFATEDSND